MREAGIPIRADMATTVAGPGGITECPGLRGGSDSNSAQQQKRRKEAKAMLTHRLQQQYGKDPVSAAIVKLEVDRFDALKSSKFTRADLDALERTISESIKAPQTKVFLPGIGERRLAPPKPGDYMRDVSGVADWTKVAKHQSGFANVAQQQHLMARARQTEDLRAQLAHQRFENKQKERASQAEKAAELLEMKQRMQEYEKESAEKERARIAKAQQDAKDRAEQVAEREARRRVDLRLKELEDIELIRQLKEEEQAKRRAAERKREEMREMSRAAEREFEESQRQREEAKRLNAAEEARLNQQWKAILDKQEADREAHMKQLKTRIFANQHTYEDTVGKKTREQERINEERRRKYIEQHEAQLKADEEARREHKRALAAAQMQTLEEQMSLRRAQESAIKHEERMNALELIEEAKEQEKRIQQKAAEQRARALLQKRDLAKQIEAKAEIKKHATKMTELEIALNRDMLLSVMDNDYASTQFLS
mmetsp:Transcript_22173/g.48351  ORF Transcript_22173/g.48351 Transcript_22173/m.48351 type:complete len:484 (-) Transcript_22173:328-1779(-)